jgi:hypothetical protein
VSLGSRRLRLQRPYGSNASMLRSELEVAAKPAYRTQAASRRNSPIGAFRDCHGQIRRDHRFATRRHRLGNGSEAYPSQKCSGKRAPTRRSEFHLRVEIVARSQGAAFRRQLGLLRQSLDEELLLGCRDGRHIRCGATSLVSIDPLVLQLDLEVSSSHGAVQILVRRRPACARIFLDALGNLQRFTAHALGRRPVMSLSVTNAVAKPRRVRLREIRAAAAGQAQLTPPYMGANIGMGGGGRRSRPGSGMSGWTRLGSSMKLLKYCI